MSRYKKIAWLVFALGLTYFSLVSLLFYRNYRIAKQNDAQIQILTSGTKNKKSDGYEIRILSVEVDGTKEKLHLLKGQQEGILYEDGMLVIRDGVLKIPVKETSNVSVQFLKHPWSGIADIKSDSLDIENSVDLYHASDDTYTFHYTWDTEEAWRNAFQLKSSNKSDRFRLIVTSVCICFIVHLCILAFYKFVRHFADEKLSIWNLVSVSAAGFTIALLSLYTLFHAFRGWLLGVLFLLILLFMIRNKHVIEKNVRYAFAVLYIPAAILFLFFLPPGHVLDEYAHFVKVYEASVIGDSHTVFRKGYEEEGKVYIHLPESIQKLGDVFTDNIQEYNVKYELEKYYDAYTDKLDKESICDDIFWYGNTANLNITSYIPGILAEVVLIILDCPPLLMFQLLRFISMLLTCITGYYTISILPDCKKIFLTILLLPMTVQQGIGINQDCMTNCVCFLTIAYILKTRESDKFRRKDLLVLLLLSFLLGNVKQVYFPVLLLVFAVPSEKFSSRKNAYISKFTILLPGTVIAVCTCFFAVQSVVSTGRLPYYTMDFIFRHPLQTAGIYLNTFLNDGMYHFQGGLYNGFGWYTHYCRGSIGGLIGDVMFLLLVGAGERKLCSKEVRVYSMSAFLLICILIYTSMFLGWTTVDAESVYGLQPRYFIVPLLCLVIAVQNRCVCICSKWKNCIYVGCVFGILCNAVWTIATGFYY